MPVSSWAVYEQAGGEQDSLVQEFDRYVAE